MALRTCTVSCEDSDGHQHSLEVTAETLYEAVAQALAAFKSNEWVGQIGRGHAITVRVQQPAIEHRVRSASPGLELGALAEAISRQSALTNRSPA
jgi:hypothetical protein